MTPPLDPGPTIQYKGLLWVAEALMSALFSKSCLISWLEKMKYANEEQLSREKLFFSLMEPLPVASFLVFM